MLEVKAFIRVNVVDKVIQALEAAGISNVTVIDVRALWQGLRREDLEYSLELAERRTVIAAAWSWWAAR